MQQLLQQYNDMQELLMTVPDTTKKLQDLQEYWSKCDDILLKLQKTVSRTGGEVVFEVINPSWSDAMPLSHLLDAICACAGRNPSIHSGQIYFQPRQGQAINNRRWQPHQPE